MPSFIEPVDGQDFSFLLRALYATCQIDDPESWLQRELNSSITHYKIANKANSHGFTYHRCKNYVATSLIAHTQYSIQECASFSPIPHLDEVVTYFEGSDIEPDYIIAPMLVTMSGQFRCHYSVVCIIDCIEKAVSIIEPRQSMNDSVVLAPPETLKLAYNGSFSAELQKNSTTLYSGLHALQILSVCQHYFQTMSPGDVFNLDVILKNLKMLKAGSFAALQFSHHLTALNGESPEVERNKLLHFSNENARRKLYEAAKSLTDITDRVRDCLLNFSYCVEAIPVYIKSCAALAQEKKANLTSRIDEGGFSEQVAAGYKVISDKVIDSQSLVMQPLLDFYQATTPIFKALTDLLGPYQAECRSEEGGFMPPTRDELNALIALLEKIINSSSFFNSEGCALYTAIEVYNFLDSSHDGIVSELKNMCVALGALSHDYESHLQISQRSVKKILGNVINQDAVLPFHPSETIFSFLGEISSFYSHISSALECAYTCISQAKCYCYTTESDQLNEISARLFKLKFRVDKIVSFQQSQRFICVVEEVDALDRNIDNVQQKTPVTNLERDLPTSDVVYSKQDVSEMVCEIELLRSELDTANKVLSQKDRSLATLHASLERKTAINESLSAACRDNELALEAMGKEIRLLGSEKPLLKEVSNDQSWKSQRSELAISNFRAQSEQIKHESGSSRSLSAPKKRLIDRMKKVPIVQRSVRAFLMFFIIVLFTVIPLAVFLDIGILDMIGYIRLQPLSILGDLLGVVVWVVWIARSAYKFMSSGYLNKTSSSGVLLDVSRDHASQAETPMRKDRLSGPL